MGGQWHTLVILGAADKSQLRHERQMSDFGCRVILHDLDHSALQRRYGGYLDHKTRAHLRVGVTSEQIQTKILHSRPWTLESVAAL